MNFLENFLLCAIISSCVFINFWGISCPLGLFHTVRVLGSQEYIAFIFFETEILFIFFTVNAKMLVIIITDCTWILLELT